MYLHFPVNKATTVVRPGMTLKNISKITSRVMNGSNTLTINTINRTRTFATKVSNIPSKVNCFAKRRPVVFGSGIAFLKTIGADLAVQTYLENKKISEVDWKRNMAIGGFGLFYTGAFSAVLYGKLYPFLFNRIKNQKLATVGQLSLDLLIHTPFIYFPVYHIYKNTINKQEFSVASVSSVCDGYFHDSIKRDVPKMWGVWLPAHCLTFTLIPTHLRVPWITAISFGWTMILSYTS